MVKEERERLKGGASDNGDRHLCPPLPMASVGSRRGLPALWLLAVFCAAVLAPCLCTLRVKKRSDTVYITEVPFYSTMEIDIAVDGDWIISMAACHEGLPFQDIFQHKGQGPMDGWTFALQWNEVRDIHVNITLFDLPSNRGWNQYRKFAVKFLEPVSYLLVDRTQGHHLRTLNTIDDTVAELVAWAVEELSTTRRILWSKVISRVLATPPRLPCTCTQLAAVPGRMHLRPVHALVIRRRTATRASELSHCPVPMFFSLSLFLSLSLSLSLSL